MLRQLSGFTFQRMDISEIEQVNNLAKAIGPVEAVINLAARAGVRSSVENPWIYYSTNVTGTLNLLEQLTGNQTLHKTYCSSQSPIAASLASNLFTSAGLVTSNVITTRWSSTSPAVAIPVGDNPGPVAECSRKRAKVSPRAAWAGTANWMVFVPATTACDAMRSPTSFQSPSWLKSSHASK